MYNRHGSVNLLRTSARNAHHPGVWIDACLCIDSSKSILEIFERFIKRNTLNSPQASQPLTVFSVSHSTERRWCLVGKNPTRKPPAL